MNSESCIAGTSVISALDDGGDGGDAAWQMVVVLS